MAEVGVALLFAATRGVVAADADVRRGEIYKDGTIPYQRFRAWELAGRTAGLVGLGAVGRALRWRLRGLGLEVIAYDPYADEPTVSLDELLSRSDVVSLHAPVTPETTGMIGADEFAAMRDGVVFLNTARAALHDTDALVDALRSGKVSAAGLDHFEGESLAVDHPLTQLGSVVLTPHIGGATYNVEANHTRTIAEDLCRLMAGAATTQHRQPRGARRTVRVAGPGQVKRWAARAASVARVRVGPYPAEVTNTDESATTTLSAWCRRPAGSTTDVAGSVPIRTVPML